MNHGRESGASDVVGSILLVGITVLTTAAFATILFAFDGPQDTLHAEVELRVDAGSGGWSTGDEALELLHMGGEPIPAHEARIIIRQAGVEQLIEGAALGSAFSDGSLTIGEVWRGPSMTLAQDTPLEAWVVAGTARSMVVGSGTVTGTASLGVGCALDTTPPVSTFVQNPPDVRTTTAGAVAIQATLVDACAGVEPSVTPRLFYRVTPQVSYSDAGAMTSIGTNQWSTTIPAPPGGWSSQAGQTLQYYISPLTDKNGNTGQSGIRSDLVDADYVYTYVASNVVTKGSVTDFAAARSASDGGDEAALDEASTVTVPGTGSGTFSGPASATNTAPSPDNARTSNDVRVTLDANGEYVEVYGFDLPAQATSVSTVVIGFEGRKSQSGGQDPHAVLSYGIGGLAGVLSRTVTMSSDVDASYTQAVTPDKATWTVADVESMRVRVAAANIGNRNLQVDHIYVTVTYVTGGTTYAMDIQLDWTGVPAGASHAIQLQYRTAVDTFTVEVSDGAAWRTCPGTLASAAATPWSCTLQAGEHQAGAPRIRIRDTTPSGSNQGSLFLDYARVGTV